MELIYFISGILVVGVVYGINLLRHVKSSHTNLLGRFQSQSNISSIRYGEFLEKVENAESFIKEVKLKMEKDQYRSISEINVDIKNLKEVSERNAQKQNDTSKSVTVNINKAFTEIQTLKNNIKAMGRDPNFLSRY